MRKALPDSPTSPHLWRRRRIAYSWRMPRLALTAAFVLLAGLVPWLASPAEATAPARATWRPFAPVPQGVDVAGPRRDGTLVVAAGGRLSLIPSGGNLPRPFARGPDGYSTSSSTEHYIALAPQRRLRRARCSWRRDDLYALEAVGARGITRVDRAGRARRFANLPAAAGLPNGIAFDRVGTFGHRLLVTQADDSATAVYAVNCRGRVSRLTASAPRVEGGIEVAPRGFGRFGGQLIAPDELSGRVWAIDARGRSRLLVQPRLPSGGDIGVESVGFVPRGFEHGHALLADRGVPGNAHPGTDTVLRVSGGALRRAGVRRGDLLVATEGAALTVAVRCGERKCSVRRVADGPSVAHAEGHIAFDVPPAIAAAASRGGRP